MQDPRVVAHLKALLLVHCVHILHEESVTALLLPDTERSVELDDAIWRVWTFCELFAVSKGREDDLQGQLS